MILAVTGDLEPSGSRAQELSPRMLSRQKISFGKIYCSEGLGHGSSVSEKFYPLQMTEHPAQRCFGRDFPDSWTSGKLLAFAFCMR